MAMPSEVNDRRHTIHNEYGSRVDHSHVPGPFAWKLAELGSLLARTLLREKQLFDGPRAAMPQQPQFPIGDPQGRKPACPPLQMLIDALELRALLGQNGQIHSGLWQERRSLQRVDGTPEGTAQQIIDALLVLLPQVDRVKAGTAQVLH